MGGDGSRCSQLTAARRRGLVKGIGQGRGHKGSLPLRPSPFSAYCAPALLPHLLAPWALNLLPDVPFFPAAVLRSELGCTCHPPGLGCLCVTIILLQSMCWGRAWLWSLSAVFSWDFPGGIRGPMVPFLSDWESWASSAEPTELLFCLFSTSPSSSCEPVLSLEG